MNMGRNGGRFIWRSILGALGKPGFYWGRNGELLKALDQGSEIIH